MSANTAVYDRMTAWEMVEYFGLLYGIGKDELVERMERLFARLKMNEIRDLLGAKMSTGMKQKVKLATALVHDPQVLFLDEPTNGLDPAGRREMLRLIRELTTTYNKSVILSSHILSDVESICDRVAIIVKGRIRHQGSIEDFLPDDRRTTDVLISSLPPETAEEIAERFDVEMRGLGERLELRVAEKEVNGVLDAVMRVGAEVVSVTPHRNSLEDVFLDAVRAGEGA